VEEAMDAVFGYTIYNDFSARDAQAQETSFRMGPAKGKDFDTGNAMGPCIVTRDEIADPYALAMRVSVNGKPRCETVSGGMQHDIARCISFLSQSETLYPGEVLAMGTVGNGCGYESLTFLDDGDVVDIEVEGIGLLRNQLVKHKELT
jgi:2-keto-4-pentenoate hydratase/2-oxohepta-3-ene-1,7-dioic acid hydratase in catechol pathway